MADSKQTTIQSPSVSTKGMGKRIGSSGTSIYGGIITGEEYNRNTTGYVGLKNYDIMRRSDSTVHRTLLVCKLPIISALWYMEPASDDEQDQYQARYINRELFERNIMFSDNIRQALSEFDFGFSAAEKTYEWTEFEGNKQIGLESLMFMKQTTIQRWALENGDPGVVQQTIDGTVEIPRYKLAVFTHDKEGDNDEGISLLRYVYKDWDIKDKLVLVNAIALERLGLGIPMVEFGDDVDETEKETARRLLRGIRVNEEAYLERPKDSKIEMLDMKSSSTKEALPTIAYHDRQIVASVLAQFLEFGQKTGTQALSKDATSMFEKSLEAVAKNVQAVYQKSVVQQLCDLNFSSMPNGYPQLKFGKIGDDDIQVLSEAVSAVAGAGGITWTFDTEQAMRKIMRLPELPDDYRDEFDELMKTAKKNKANTTAEPAATGKEDDLNNADENNKDKNVNAAVSHAKKARKILVKVLDED